MFHRPLQKPFGRIDVDIESHKTVHENRAPTDQSVQLLREMEQKARDNILLAIRSDSNDFKYTASVYSDNHQFTHRLRVQFAINGHQHDIDFELPFQYRDMKGKDLILQVRDLVAKELANLITIDLLRARVFAGAVPGA